MTGPCLCGDPYCKRCFPCNHGDPRHDETEISWQCEHKIHGSCKVKNRYGKLVRGDFFTCGCDCHESDGSREPDWDAIREEREEAREWNMRET